MSTQKDSETLYAIFFILLLVTGLIVPYLFFKIIELVIETIISELPTIAKMFGIAVDYVKRKISTWSLS